MPLLRLIRDILVLLLSFIGVVCLHWIMQWFAALLWIMTIGNCDLRRGDMGCKNRVSTCSENDIGGGICSKS